MSVEKTKLKYFKGDFLLTVKLSVNVKLFHKLPGYIQDIDRHSLKQRKHLQYLKAPRRKNPKPVD